MPEIQQLSAHLVNKIAAGEVIERPASVVKELVENAIDAGADRVEITIEDGGRRRIAITDDGRGMGAEDLALAFAPHATSKITAEDDLFRIATMGFRGEALASIASISHAHIRTRPRDDGESGWEVEASGNQVGEVRPSAGAPGTTVTVRDLFFNTPARRKFLRTASTEFGHICEQLARVALPHPQVAFRLTHNGREVQNLPPVTTTLQRVADLFDQELAESLLPLAGREGEVTVNGLIGKPGAARSSSKWQYVFLNGRYIRDRLLLHAIREAYRGLLPPNRWPVAFLFLEVAPEDVDVNVHPTKVEVRFRDSNKVHGTLYAALKETLNRANLTPDATLDKAEADGGGQYQGDPEQTDQRRESVKQALAEFFKSMPEPQPRLDFPDQRGAPGQRQQKPPAASQPQAPPTPQADPQTESAEGAGTSQADAGARNRPMASIIPDRLPKATPDKQSTQPSAPADRPAPAPPPAAPSQPATGPARQTGLSSPPDHALPQVIQVADTYLAFAEPDGLVIIDQHALHERILYNEFMQRLTDGRLEGQRLLIPEPLSVTPAEANLVAEHGELLARLGIEIQSFGPQTVAVQQFPTVLIERGVEARAFLRELLDQLTDDETTSPERAVQAVLAMMACKAAIKAGDPLTPGEIEDLLARREGTDKASSCPHGRPTTLRIPVRDLEKQFKRT
ncbi:MAG: DNA mismatch repair endonuclease MutL [Planctomycetota bacterium]